MSDEDFDLIEYVEWLKHLEAEGKISDLKLTLSEDGHLDLYFKPAKPVEFISFDLKVKQ